MPTLRINLLFIFIPEYHHHHHHRSGYLVSYMFQLIYKHLLLWVFGTFSLLSDFASSNLIGSPGPFISMVIRGGGGRVMPRSCETRWKASAALLLLINKLYCSVSINKIQLIVAFPADNPAATDGAKWERATNSIGFHSDCVRAASTGPPAG